MNILLPSTHNELGKVFPRLPSGGPILTHALKPPAIESPKILIPGQVNSPFPRTSGIPCLLQSRLPTESLPVST